MDSSSGENDRFDSLSSFVKHGKIFPKQAPDWNLEHLSEIGIQYDENTTDLENLMSVLKMRENIMCKGLDKMPQISYTLLEYTKDVWRYSYAFDKEKGNGIIRASQKAEEAIEEFEKKECEWEEKLGTLSSNAKRLYFGWRVNLLDFWKYFCMLLTRWSKPSQREGKFTQLFTAFSKIFFLYPESGDAYKESMIIKDLNVHGIPDIRFMTFVDETLKLLIVTEVKQYDALRGDYDTESFTLRNVSSKVLGQHGIELLLEARDAYFFPYVLGLLCIGTKVIFTYMYIEIEAYNEIAEQGAVQKPKKVIISYTRPYDYMDIGDRDLIMEPFFWLGYVQSNAYKYRLK